MDEEALIASLTRTRTLRTRMRHHGGNRGPLVGSRVPVLLPVRRRKPNKNNGLSVPTKTGGSLMPANVPASCAWRRNCRRRGTK